MDGHSSLKQMSKRPKDLHPFNSNTPNYENSGPLKQWQRKSSQKVILRK